jgi:hypothetical protein
MSYTNKNSSSVFNYYLYENKTLNSTPQNKKLLFFLALSVFFTNITLFFNGSVYSISNILNNKLSNYNSDILRNLRTSNQEFNQTTLLPTVEPTFVKYGYYMYNPLPTTRPTAEPTERPTPLPTSDPTSYPTPLSTSEPTERPTPLPTSDPTSYPTPLSTSEPTAEPSPEPTLQPTHLYKIIRYNMVTRY